MGCAAAKEAVAEDGRHNHNHRHGGMPGDIGQWPDNAHRNPHEIAVAQHMRDLENKKPQSLESYWVAGSIDCTNAPPHYVPLRGPMGGVQKLPPHAPNIRKRVLTCLVTSPLLSAALASGHQPTSPLLTTATTSSPLLATTGDQTELDASTAGMGLVAPRGPSDGPLDDEYAAPPPLTMAPPQIPELHVTNGDGGASTPQRQAIRGAIVGVPLSGLSSARRLRQRPNSVGGGGGGAMTEDPVTAMLLSFPMPRWFAVEQQLPSSERVLLEAAEGKLSIHGDTRSSCMSNGGGGKASSTTNSGLMQRPPLAPSPMLEVGALEHNPMGLQQSGSTVAAAAAGFGCHMRAHYVVPDDAIVGRAFLPHALHNYTVGWIKVPVAPVTFKQSVSVNTPDAIRRNKQPPHQPLVEVVVIRNDIDGLLPNDEGPDNALTGTTTTLPDAASAIGRVGFLSPDKPVYNTALDGPVMQPFERPPGTPAHPNHVALLDQFMPRYLEKYYLYVKKVTALCITLSWKNASDLDAGYTDVSLHHQVALPCDRQQQQLFAPGEGSGGGDTLESRSTAAAAAQQRRSLGGGQQQRTTPYFMALPVATASAAKKTASGSHQATDALQEESTSSSTSVSGCLPSLHDAMLLGETSLPLYLNTPIRLLFPALAPHLAAFASMATSPSAEAMPRPLHKQRHEEEEDEAITHDPRLQHAKWIAAFVKKLRHDDICWLAFRLRFLEWLMSAVQSSIRAQQQHPRADPLPPTSSQLQAVHLALRLGLRFQYDNTEFFAFNEHGRNNYRAKPVGDGGASPSGTDTAGGGTDALLAFVDKSRTPHIETSSMVAESPTIVMSCRLAHVAAAALPSPPAHCLGPSPDTTTFYSETEAEVAQLRCLFGQFIPDVYLH